MTSCRIHNQLQSCSGYFDVVSRVHSISFSGHKYSFSPGLNIIVGKSGSGKTSLLEAIKEQSEAVELSFPESLTYLSQPLSPGQEIMLIFKFLIQSIPSNACLLIDDVFGRIDKWHQQALLDRIDKSGKQVIMTAGTDVIEGRSSLGHVTHLPFE